MVFIHYASYVLVPAPLYPDKGKLSRFCADCVLSSLAGFGSVLVASRKRKGEELCDCFLRFSELPPNKSA
jgi:hypothetical protein